MTIKQQGGVFGRNPSFNDVEVNTVSLSGDANFADNSKAVFGNEGDLQIFHDGTSSRIKDVGTGSLIIDTNGNGVLIEAGTGENLAYFDAINKRVVLYHSDSSKLLTASSGVFVTDNLTLDTGNLVIGTSGKGIDFSATAGTGTSELFNDYEEGSFSGSISGITATTATYVGTYTKLGNICHIQVLLTISGKTAGAGNPSIAVPFAAASTSTAQFGGQPTQNGIFGSTDMYFAVYNGGTTVYAYTESGATLGAANWNDGVTAVNFTYKTA